MISINIDEYLDGYSFLGAGCNNPCFYKDSVAVKVFSDYYLASKESAKMIAANGVNSLSVKFLLLETIKSVHFLFMEKLTPLTQQEIDNISVSDRRVMTRLAADQLIELHEADIYHGDIKSSPSSFNIVVTTTGIKLIDWGWQSVQNDGELFRRLCKEYSEKDWNNWNDFTGYFYNL